MRKLLSFFWFCVKAGFVLAVLGVLLIYALYKYYEPELPSVESIRQYKMQVPLRVYSNDGLLISVFGTKRRIPVSIDDVPLRLKQAYIAAEDANFYSHYGFDVKGILRAVWQIIATGEKKGGGSTITQQLTRNVFLTLDRTWSRKIKELFLAIKLEQTISKDEILELYLNKIALGHRSYGVAAAAEVYYGKTLSELSLAESAMLAAPPKAPSKINPVTNPERALQRRDYVLGRMLELGFINEQEYQQAITEPDQAYVHQPVVELNAPWVAEMVRTEMVARYGDAAYTDGYQVITTIDSVKQRAAEQALRKGLHDYDQRHGFRGAVAHYEPPKTELDWEKISQKLADLPQPAGLRAGLVTEVDAQSALLRLADGQDTDIKFTDSKWAAPFIDNRRIGAKPKQMGDIVKVGDVVMLQRNDEGDFQLSQIPQAQGALVSLNPNDGGLYALVGGYDYQISKFNRATQAKRQPGSGFKPIIYSAALDLGLHASSIINDAPIVFEDKLLERTWRPENYSEKFFGPTRLREGLVKSRNLVSIRVLRQIGIEQGREHVMKFGFNPNDVPKNLSISLGTPTVPVIDMSQAYAIFANGGYAVEPYLIKTIGVQNGEQIYHHQAAVVCEECPPTDLEQAQNAEAEPTIIPAPRVISTENQFIIDSFMRDVIRRGTGTRALSLKRHDLAGKTGTTNDQKDAWFNGYQKNIVTNVWVGFDTPETLGRGEVGGRVALPIWIDYMQVALQNQAEWQPPIPPGVVSVNIDKTSGHLVKRGTPNSMVEYFMSNNLPAEKMQREKPKYDDLF